LLASGSHSSNSASGIVAGFVQFNIVRNVSIDLESNPSANNQHGSVALYASATELFSLENVYFRGDYGMCNGEPPNSHSRLVLPAHARQEVALCRRH